MTPQDLENQGRRTEQWRLIAIIIGGIAAVVLLFWIFSGGPAAAQSFSCRNADNRTEMAICDHRDLARLDERMEVAFGRALRRGFTTESEQGRWRRRDRDACGSRPGCIRAAYIRRLRELR